MGGLCFGIPRSDSSWKNGRENAIPLTNASSRIQPGTEDIDGGT